MLSMNRSQYMGSLTQNHTGFRQHRPQLKQSGNHASVIVIWCMARIALYGGITSAIETQ